MAPYWFAAFRWGHAAQRGWKQEQVMKKSGFLLVALSGAMLGFSVPSASAQGLYEGAKVVSSPMVVASFQAPATAVPSTPQAPVRPTPDQLTQPPTAFNEAAPAGTEGSGGYAPQMLGDSLSYTTAPSLNPVNASSSARVFAALAGSAFKVTDNETIRPEDRIFMSVYHFVGVNHALQPIGAPRVRFTREVFGFEKTFLDGTMSIGMRVPFFQLRDQLGSSFADFGNVTLVGKAIAYENQENRNLLTAGLAITLPTGPNLPVTLDTPVTVGGVVVPGAFTTTQVDSVNPTIIQPFVGYYLNLGDDLYMQGFTALAFPTEDSVPTVWFNDAAAGYYLYRGTSVSVIPTAELHLTTPFGQEGSTGFPVGVVHTLISTLGTHFVWNNGPRLTFGWGFPLTGPQPFSSELIAQFNLPF